ncbi:hypothetical protein DFJ73DRAFT_832329 [Zopfochytrium polystomum]|nr:hypothetical protein DFJ73DRAFT_832329 [Zopfochytrium polystomum]
MPADPGGSETEEETDVDEETAASHSADEIVTQAAVDAARKASPLWLRQHMTEKEASDTWRTLWVLTAVTFVGIWSLAAANLAGVVIISQDFDVPAAALDEGSVRAVSAGIVAVFTGLFHLMDILAFLRARRKIKQAKQAALDAAKAAAAAKVVDEQIDDGIAGGGKDASVAAATAATPSALPTSMRSDHAKLLDPYARVHKGPPLDLVERDSKMVASAICVLVLLINLSSVVFAAVESWSFREAEQWYIASIACIGFALRRTETDLGKGLLLIFGTNTILPPASLEKTCHKEAYASYHHHKFRYRWDH